MISNTLKRLMVNWNSTNRCAAYQHRKQSENWPHNIHQVTLRSLCLTFMKPSNVCVVFVLCYVIPHS